MDQFCTWLNSAVDAIARCLEWAAWGGVFSSIVYLSLNG